MLYIFAMLISLFLFKQAIIHSPLHRKTVVVGNELTSFPVFAWKRFIDCVMCGTQNTLLNGAHNFQNPICHTYDSSANDSFNFPPAFVSQVHTWALSYFTLLSPPDNVCVTHRTAGIPEWFIIHMKRISFYLFFFCKLNNTSKVSNKLKSHKRFMVSDVSKIGIDRFFHWLKRSLGI